MIAAPMHCPVLLLVSAALFATILTPRSQALAWTAVFFVASFAFKLGLLTGVEQLFPFEIRALAIAIF